MPIHPDLHKWQVAKQAAFALASAMPGCELLQTLKGKPRIIYAGKTIDCPSWLAAWSWLQRVRGDQLNGGKDIPWAIVE